MRHYLVSIHVGGSVCVADSLRCYIKVQPDYLGGMWADSSHSKSLSLHSMCATWTES